MSERLYEYKKITDLKDMLKKSGEEYGNQIAYQIKTGEKTYKNITHKEVRTSIDALGTALIDMGLKNKRIAIIGGNRLEWEIAYLSIVCGTGVVVPLDKSLPENELRKLIECSQVEAIFYSQKYEEMLVNAKKEGVGKLKYLISMDRKQSKKDIYSERELIEVGKQLLKKGNKQFTEAQIESQGMSIMLFTSGTTSQPKIVALSHYNLCANLMDLASVLDINSNDVFLSFLPLHHVFECTVGFLLPLYKGAKIVFCDGIRHIIENMKEYKITVMASVPAIYERIFKVITRQIEQQGKTKEILEKQVQYEHHDMEKKKEIFQDVHDMLGGNIKLFISGAASLNADIEKNYRLLGINIVQAYGLTETSPVIAIGTKKYHKNGSIGKALPSVEAKVIHTDSEGIGELIVQGPNIMLGYYNNEIETQKVVVDGWFYTGDLAKVDKEGYIFICGRKKNVIVLKNGKNIFPEEMESLINKIEGVEESFVFGKQITEDKNDIKVFAKLVYNPEVVENVYKVKEKEEIYQIMNKKIKEINQTMPHYKSIRGSILTQEPLIKTATNKIKRQSNLEQIRKEETIWY